MNDIVEMSSNPFGSSKVAARNSSAVAEVDMARAVAEVQAAMTIAKRFPRDPILAMDLILQDCTRPTLAEGATYEYSRGGSSVTGPSIRLAETIGRRWGNMESGVRELSRHNGFSECVAYAWDMETNFRDTKTFQVKHWRDTKKGGYAITDERDIYELVANMGARRKRACILAILPDDVVQAAVEQCDVTLKTKIEITDDSIAGMLSKFAEYGITKDHVQKKIQRHLDAITPALFLQLRKIYNSLKDGMSSPADWFEIEPVIENTETGQAKPATGANALKAAVNKRKAAAGDAGKGPIVGIGDLGVQRTDAATAMQEGEDPSAGMGEGGGAPTVKYEALLTRLQNASDLDVLNVDAGLIGLFPQDQINVLTDAYKKRLAELSK